MDYLTSKKKEERLSLDNQKLKERSPFVNLVRRTTQFGDVKNLKEWMSLSVGIQQKRQGYVTGASVEIIWEAAVPKEEYVELMDVKKRTIDCCMVGKLQSQRVPTAK